MSNVAYIFFNCDDSKSHESMNILFNDEAYGNSGSSRRKLLAKILEERAAGRVKIAEENLKSIEAHVLKGNPEDASALMQYGAVKAVTII